MQFKKLAAIAGSALITGMTLAGAALAATNVGTIANLAKPVDTTANFPLFVIGATAATADVAGAVDIAVRMAAESKTSEAVITAAGAAETATKGAKLSASGNELTPYETVQSVKGILTTSDIDILKTQSYATATGGSYQYKQYLYVAGETTNAASAAVKYERPTNENTPRIAFKVPGSQQLYEYKLAFSTPVSLSGLTTTAGLQGVIQGTTLSLMGKDFVVSDCTFGAVAPAVAISDITLLGGKNVITVGSDADKTVTITGKDYVIHLSSVVTESVGATTYNTAVGDVNGESFTLRSGATATLSDGTIIGAINVLRSGIAGGIDYIKIAVGAEKIKLSQAGTVTKGTTTVADLTAGIISTTTAGWSSMTIIYTPSTDAWKNAGESVSDPFTDAFSIKFNSINPTFEDTTNRQTISLAPSAYNMLLTYKNAVDAEKQVYTSYCSGCTAAAQTWIWASAAVTATGSDNNWRDLVFDESANISAYDQDYFVIQKSGFSHVLQFTSWTPTTGEMTFTDESGNSITATNTTGATGQYTDLIVDGNTYKVNIYDAARKVVLIDLDADTYISGTAATAVPVRQLGAEYSHLVPKLVTKDKGGLYFYRGNNTQTNTTTPTYPQLGFAGIRWAVTGGAANPYKVTVSTESAGLWTAETTEIVVPVDGSLNNATYTKDYIDFAVNCKNVTTVTTCNVGLGATAATMQTDKRGFILVQEETKGAVHNWVFFPVAWDATNSRTYITTPVSDDANYDANLAVLGTSTQYKGITTYGTLIEYLSSTLGGSATIKYPDTYMTANVYMLAPEGKITTGGVAGEVTTEKVLGIKTDVVKLDTEVTAADKAAKDIIMVGGPCVNTLVAALAADGKFTYACDTWPAENFAIVKTIENAFATGKVAVVVAGTRAVDTDLACMAIQADKLAAQTATEVKVKGTSLETLTFE